MTKGGVQTERSETEESETLNLQGSAMFSSNVFFGPDCLRRIGEGGGGMRMCQCAEVYRKEHRLKWINKKHARKTKEERRNKIE
jgi:hypothetical protein